MACDNSLVDRVYGVYCLDCAANIRWTLTTNERGAWYYGDCDCRDKTWRAYPKWQIEEYEV